MQDWVLELSALFGLVGEINLRDKTGDKAVRVVKFPRKCADNEKREGEGQNHRGTQSYLRERWRKRCQMIQNQGEKEN